MRKSRHREVRQLVQGLADSKAYAFFYLPFSASRNGKEYCIWYKEQQLFLLRKNMKLKELELANDHKI